MPEKKRQRMRRLYHALLVLVGAALVLTAVFMARDALRDVVTPWSCLCIALGMFILTALSRIQPSKSSRVLQLLRNTFPVLGAAAVLGFVKRSMPGRLVSFWKNCIAVLLIAAVIVAAVDFLRDRRSRSAR